MKATINVEFGSEELERFASNAGVKMLTKLFGSIKLDPNEAPMYFDLFKQSFLTAVDGVQSQHAHRHRQPNGASPQPFGGPFGPPAGYPGGPPPGMRPDYEYEPESRCLSIESSRDNEAGIHCCQCHTYNGLQRVNCRNCGHKLCVIETPPPKDDDSPVGVGPR